MMSGAVPSSGFLGTIARVSNKIVLAGKVFCVVSVVAGALGHPFWRARLPADRYEGPDVKQVEAYGYPGYEAVVAPWVPKLSVQLPAAPVAAPVAQAQRTTPVLPMISAEMVRGFKDDVVAATLVLEAEGEGKRGMQAVMNVIANRCKKDPERFYAVVVREEQFSCWNPVTRSEEPDFGPLLARAKKSPMWAHAQKLVTLAQEDNLRDITRGATSYLNKKIATDRSWMHQLRNSTTIGDHTFGQVDFPKAARGSSISPHLRPEAYLARQLTHTKALAGLQ